jgi:hypothetical protein
MALELLRGADVKGNFKKWPSPNTTVITVLLATVLLNMGLWVVVRVPCWDKMLVTITASLGD